MPEFDQPEWEPAENVHELEEVTRFHEQYPHALPVQDAPALEGKFGIANWKRELREYEYACCVSCVSTHVSCVRRV